MEFGVPGAINLTHAAHAKLSDNFIGAKARARGKGQTLDVDYTSVVDSGEGITPSSTWRKSHLAWLEQPNPHARQRQNLTRPHDDAGLICPIFCQFCRAPAQAQV